MLLTQGALRKKSAELSAEIAAARSARNLGTRRRREQAAEEREADRHRRRRKRKDDREFEQLLRRRVRIRVLPEERPRIGSPTARKLYHRMVGMLPGTIGLSDARGTDGLYSLHFGFVARGFASTTGRRWRAGEAERAARYIVREDGLEEGERGWWSNIADDRVELVAFFRTAEAIERHDRKNANVYCSEIIALPAELTAANRRQAVRRICAFFETRGLPYVAAVHLPDEAGDQRNFHCHIIYSLRPAERNDTYDWDFGLTKVGDINTPKGILERRHQVVQDINATLYAAGIDKRYSPLSNKARRITAAQEKIGQNGTWISRRLTAMEAREAFLKNVQAFAGHVKSSLVDASSTLTRLRMEVDLRRAEQSHRIVVEREVLARAAGRTARLEAMRKLAEQRLIRQRSKLIAESEGARMAVQQGRQRVASALDTSKASIQRTSDVTIRIGRVGRQARLRTSLNDVDIVRKRIAVRMTDTTTVVKDRLRSTRFSIAITAIHVRDRIERERERTLNALTRRREELAAAIVETQRHVTRVWNHVQARQALIEQQRLLDDAAIDQDWRALSLRQRRRIAIARAKTMATAAQSAVPLPGRLAACDSIALARLHRIRQVTVEHSDALNHALAATRANGARLLANLSKGPKSEKATADIGAAARKSESAVGPIAQEGSSPVGKAPDASSPVTRNRSRDQDALRKIIREHKPPKNIAIFPPPSAERGTPDLELLRQRAHDMEVLRAEVRRREKRVRAALREQTMRRLRRLDIEVIAAPDGGYAVAAGILSPDEIRVLMDVALHKETQDFLAHIAKLRREARTIATPPIAKQAPAADEEYERLLRQQQFQADRSGMGQQ